MHPVGQPFIELPTVESTNNYAMGLVREGMAQQGTAVFAHEQTKGKGQRGKQWITGRNQNIALSVILQPGEAVRQPFLLSMTIANAVLQFFKRYVPEEVTIKWPNDLYWRDRKAAGILIENLWQGSEWKFAVAGIGININQVDFEGLTTPAVSLKQITGQEYEPVMLAKELCGDIDGAMKELQRDPKEVVWKYKSNLYKLNQRVKLRKEARVFDAVIKDVTLEGELVVQAGVEERFAVGEVEWNIEQGTRN